MKISNNNNNNNNNNNYSNNKLNFNIYFLRNILILLLVIYPNTCQSWTWYPTASPTTQPTLATFSPTYTAGVPTPNPTHIPSAIPTATPTPRPTATITNSPSANPTFAPTPNPSATPTLSASPTANPTRKPTATPSNKPTKSPLAPSPLPTAPPIFPITDVPTSSPTRKEPTPTPSSQPSNQPSGQPSSSPSKIPSGQPSGSPTGVPTQGLVPSFTPTRSPTSQPSSSPSKVPSGQPSGSPSSLPTSKPSPMPTLTRRPSRKPTAQPSAAPTLAPTATRTANPTPIPTARPTNPTSVPTGQPTRQPTSQPSMQPSTTPTETPSRPSATPTEKPTAIPTANPSAKPTANPSAKPTAKPTFAPTEFPTIMFRPTANPTTALPTLTPTIYPTSAPSISREPTSFPSSQPTMVPSTQPTSQPTTQPSVPTSMPQTSKPTPVPTAPTADPTPTPTADPTADPTAHPTRAPTAIPTARPTAPFVTVSPTPFPTGCPSSLPSGRPSSQPTVSSMPTGQPSMQPSGAPSSKPTTWWDETAPPTTTYEYMNVTGIIVLSPADSKPCEVVDIRFDITFQYNISNYDTLYFETPGITSGPCVDAVNGVDSVNFGDKKIRFKVWGNDPFIPFNDTDFNLVFHEGTFAKRYKDSFVELNLQLADLIPRQQYSVQIDRWNGLRRGCIDNSTWSVSALRYEETNKFYTLGTLPLQDNVVKQCFVYNSTILFSPPQQQLFIGFNFTLQLAMEIRTGDYIKITLPGFTNRKGNLPGTVIIGDQLSNYFGEGSNVSISDGVTWSTDFSWNFLWVEGDNSTTFNESFIALIPQGDLDAGTEFWIDLDRFNNHLFAQCGSHGNYPQYSIQLISGVNSLYIAREPIKFSNPIGTGCSNYNSCNGHGDCDYCASKCKCFDGYGSIKDLITAVSNDFNADCSSKTCPIGPSSGSTPIKLLKEGYHREMECSNNGICDRDKGICSCFQGFNGSACEKLIGSCLDTDINGEICSGNGQCLSMNTLANHPNAIPLQREKTHYHLNEAIYTDGTSWNGSHTHKYSKAWDHSSSHGCLCDSSWEVGLGSGQTQQAEYFGPSCNYRHCPSGDDPYNKDLTNCTGKVMFPGGDAGEDGNLCHVDCSNRGVCDFDTGLCKCFEGWTDSNCGLAVTQAKYRDFKRDPSAPQTQRPTPTPTATPTLSPTATPTVDPSATPTVDPSATPTADPSATPTADPSATPTADPSATPTADPSATPTADPSATPTADPSATPTADPSETPTDAPV